MPVPSTRSGIASGGSKRTAVDDDDVQPDPERRHRCRARYGVGGSRFGHHGGWPR